MLVHQVISMLAGDFVTMSRAAGSGEASRAAGDPAVAGHRGCIVISTIGSGPALDFVKILVFSCLRMD